MRQKKKTTEKESEIEFIQPASIFPTFAIDEANELTQAACTVYIQSIDG